jgi:hypothetical protein
VNNKRKREISKVQKSGTRIMITEGIYRASEETEREEFVGV